MARSPGLLGRFKRERTVDTTRDRNLAWATWLTLTLPCAARANRSRGSSIGPLAGPDCATSSAPRGKRTATCTSSCWRIRREVIAAEVSAGHRSEYCGTAVHIASIQQERGYDGKNGQSVSKAFHGECSDQTDVPEMAQGGDLGACATPRQL